MKEGRQAGKQTESIAISNAISIILERDEKRGYYFDFPKVNKRFFSLSCFWPVESAEQKWQEKISQSAQILSEKKPGEKGESQQES